MTMMAATTAAMTVATDTSFDVHKFNLRYFKQSVARVALPPQKVIVTFDFDSIFAQLLLMLIFVSSV